MLDGEFKVMGMAPYGDPKRFDLSRLLECDGKDLRVNTQLVNCIGLRRYKKDGKGYYFSPALIDWLGPMREGDEIDDPYIDYAASIQALLEDAALKLIDHYLGDIIRETGKICFAGGVALNVKLNQRIIALPGVKELFVQPAASDAGTAIGAASYAAVQAGEKVAPMEHVYLGPRYTTEQCIEPAGSIRQSPNGKCWRTPRRKPPSCWPKAIRWPGSRAAWSSGLEPWAAAASSAIPPRAEWPTSSTPRSNTANAGGRSARPCWTESRRKSSRPTTPAPT